MISSLQSVLTILYVRDQEASTRFYMQLFDCVADLHVPGMTEFTLHTNCRLGIMPNTGIAKLILPHTPDPASGDGIPRCEVYLLLHDAEPMFNRALSLGAKLISPLLQRDWGERVCYFADADGHILAFADKR